MQNAIAPTETQACERAVLDNVIQGQVTLPFLLIATRSGLDLAAFEINHRRAKTRYARGDEVIGVLAEPGTFAGPVEAGEHAVGEQIQACATGPFVHQGALVELDEVAAVGNALVTAGQRVATKAVGEEGAPGAVVDFTGTVSAIAADPVTFSPSAG
ncbi:hypothetical protein D9M71_220000 [compost metagenome]